MKFVTYFTLVNVLLIQLSNIYAAYPTAEGLFRNSNNQDVNAVRIVVKFLVKEIEEQKRVDELKEVHHRNICKLPTHPRGNIARAQSHCLCSFNQHFKYKNLKYRILDNCLSKVFQA